MNADLHDLATDYWEWQLAKSPTSALLMGDHRFDDRFEDASREAEDAEIADLRAFARRAQAIEADSLTDDERISRELLIFEAGTGADILETRVAEFGANHAIGAQALIPTTVSQFPITEAAHAEAMLPKFTAIGRYFRQLADRLREGVASGRTPHAFTVAATIRQLDDYLASPIDGDPYLRVPAPPTFDQAATDEWRSRLAEVVADHIRPALAHYRDVLVDEVTPVSQPDDRPGLAHKPGGDEHYRRAIRRHTSVDLTADQIHQVGLDQIKLLGDEYREIAGPLVGSDDLTEIYDILRNDPRFRFDTGDEVVEASKVALANATAAMGDWFGRLPAAPCVVDSVSNGPVAFYATPSADGVRPGTFYVNTANLDNWQTFFIESMAFHEGVPGHHLQLAISTELTGIPEFRKRARVTAYAEGWGLYAERLADEMGIYSGPLGRTGMLVADSMRAGRLVVDTGLHALGWSRDQAIEFLLANGPMTRSTVEAEIDRYIGMPGQALAYMVGRNEIVKYRRNAEQTMGDRFDIKGFHDVVLSSGLVPLPTLERMVAEWAAAG